MCKFYNNNDKNNKKKPHYVTGCCVGQIVMQIM